MRFQGDQCVDFIIIGKDSLRWQSTTPIDLFLYLNAQTKNRSLFPKAIPCDSRTVRTASNVARIPWNSREEGTEGFVDQGRREIRER